MPNLLKQTVFHTGEARAAQRWCCTISPLADPFPSYSWRNKKEEEKLLGTVRDLLMENVELPSTATTRLGSLGPRLQRHRLDFMGRHYSRTSFCVSSKAALLTLLWSFVASTSYQLLSQPENYTYLVPPRYLSYIYAANAFLLCFYPLAGFLADNKFGRYNSVIWSMYIMLALYGVIYMVLVILLPIFILNHLLVFFIVAAIFFVPLTASFVLFNANVIQFGMDQLHDSPSDHQSLFIHWFVWVIYLGICTSQVGSKVAFFEDSSSRYVGAVLMSITSVVSIVLLSASVWIGRRKKQWFLQDQARINPYILVYRVTKFSCRHKVPIRRSAFTFCEDELPKGLNLGKSKYGGPFTTEEVEDVKAFYGIVKVLFSLIPAFLVNVASDAILTSYADHITNASMINRNSTLEKVKELFLYNGLLSSVLTVVCIPLYICLLRPILFHYVPGMLKRIGLGVVALVLSLISTFVMDTVAHVQERNKVVCMLDSSNDNSLDSFSDASVLVVQRCLASISNMLIYVALYEFICSQSPHAMKGLLIGLSFALRGVCDMFSSLAILLFSSVHHLAFPSCGMLYYLVNIAVGVVGVLVYSCVARGYKYRVRDEVCHVYRYAEEYYSK